MPELFTHRGQVHITSPSLHQCPQVHQHCVLHVRHVYVASITALHLRHRAVDFTWPGPIPSPGHTPHLQPTIWVLEEERDGTIVYVLTTAELTWLDGERRRQGRVVEKPSCSEIIVTTSSFMRPDKEARILHVPTVCS